MIRLKFTFRGEALAVELEEGGTFRLAHRDGTGHAILSGSWGPALKLQEVHCHADKINDYFAAALQAFAEVKPATMSLDRWGKEASFDIREIERLRRENKNGGDVITQVALALGKTMTDLPSMLRRIAQLKQEATGNKRIVEKLRRKGRPPGTTAAGRWDRTVKLFEKSHYSDDVLGESCGLGVVRRRNRNFLPGDVVVIIWSNGGGSRQPIVGYSSRGHSVSHLYLDYSRYAYRSKKTPWGSYIPRKNEGETRLQNRTTLEIVELPGHLKKLSPGDPAVRQFVVGTLCAGDAAPG